jgi:hypothetical protein
VVAGRVLGKAPEMNQTPSTTAFDVALADGSPERIDAEKVFRRRRLADVQRGRTTRPTSSAMQEALAVNVVKPI